MKINNFFVKVVKADFSVNANKPSIKVTDGFRPSIVFDGKRLLSSVNTGGKTIDSSKNHVVTIEINGDEDFAIYPGAVFELFTGSTNIGKGSVISIIEE